LVELDVLPYRRPLWSAGRLEGVADGLDPDEAVAEHEGVDGVLDAVAALGESHAGQAVMSRPMPRASSQTDQPM
jgi:hypothetical protein